jgi:Asp/Glu/hydantoin racemase
MVAEFDVLMRLLIVNPNTSEATNRRIRNIAEPMVNSPDDVKVVSADSGIELIETVEQSKATEPAVLSLIEARHHEADVIIIAAFSDPGLLAAQQIAGCPVFGISQAAMSVAAQSANRFAIITVGAALRDAIQQNAKIYGYGDKLASVRLLPWTVAQVSADPPAHRAAFFEACEQAVVEDRVGAVIIGGGPLSGVADAIADQLTVPVLDGVRCAVQLAINVGLENGS